jgi:Transposase IS4
MSANLNPSRASCLDESMMEWTNQYSCPGFMFVSSKSHPFGNKWHSICFGLSSIMYAIELFKGNDKPPPTSKEYEEKGRAVAFLLCLTNRLWSTGNIVVLDSGICVLKEIIEL